MSEQQNACILMSLFVFEMSVLVGWNCPATNDNNACYFEQHNDVLNKILVVISKLDRDGFFTWLRIYDPTEFINNEKEMLRWALYTPKEEKDFKFILYEVWLSSLVVGIKYVLW